MKTIVTLIFTTLFLTTAFASSKAGYSLFNPTPDAEMREMSTDRPDKTESAYTLDAGHYQIETDLVNTAINDDNGVKSTITNYNLINIKAGLTNNSDLQVVWANYIKQQTDSEETVSGTGETVLRYKYNIYGNDEGDSAMAVMPYVKLATGKDDFTNKKTEYGILLPFAFTLPKGWDMGVMLQYDYLYNEEDSNYFNSYAVTWAFGHQVWNDLSGFVELFVGFNSEDNIEAESTLDFGLTYMIDKNVQLDTGMFLGINEAAVDTVSFFGLSVRI
jgi:hypothetical protein